MARQAERSRGGAPGVPSCALHYVVGVGAGPLKELRKQAGCDGWGVGHSQDGSLYSLQRCASELAFVAEHQRVASVVAQLAPSNWQLRSFYYEAGRLLWQQRSQGSRREGDGWVLAHAGCTKPERVADQS